MPTIYQGRCAACGYASDLFPAESGAVLVDRPVPGLSGTAVAGAALYEDVAGAAFAEPSDPRLVALAHPLEQDILSAAGYTWGSCAWAGRYVRIRRVVCRGCGTLFEVRRLTCPPAFGCLPALLVGAGVGAAAGIQEGNFCPGFFAGYLATLGCWGLVAFGMGLFTRLRFRERARSVAGPGRCPRCGADRYSGVPTGRRRWPCPQCGQRTLTVRAVGIA